MHLNNREDAACCTGIMLSYGKCSSVCTLAEYNATTAKLCTSHDLTCIESPECVIWGVACIVCHVQGGIWLLPFEGYKGAVAAIAEALADCPIDCQATANVCQLFRQLGTTKRFLQNKHTWQCHCELIASRCRDHSHIAAMYMRGNNRLDSMLVGPS